MQRGGKKIIWGKSFVDWSDELCIWGVWHCMDLRAAKFVAFPFSHIASHRQPNHHHSQHLKLLWHTIPLRKRRAPHTHHYYSAPIVPSQKSIKMFACDYLAWTNIWHCFKNNNNRSYNDDNNWCQTNACNRGPNYPIAHCHRSFEWYRFWLSLTICKLFDCLFNSETATCRLKHFNIIPKDKSHLMAHVGMLSQPDKKNDATNQYPLSRGKCFIQVLVATGCGLLTCGAITNKQSFKESMKKGGRTLTLIKLSAERHLIKYSFARCFGCLFSSLARLELILMDKWTLNVA